MLERKTCHCIVINVNIICNDRSFHCWCALNLVAGYRTSITHGNLVILADMNASFSCYSSYYRRPTWHFYSLTSRACTFGSGTYRCASASRASLVYSSSSSTNSTTLTISRIEMSDAGTYTCSGSSRHDYRSTASSIIVGVIGKCTYLELPFNRLSLYKIGTRHCKRRRKLGSKMFTVNIFTV